MAMPGSKVQALSPFPSVPLVDIHGEPVVVGNGRRLLLSLFREATCPFCNVRVSELTHQYKGLSAQGLDIVAVFSSTREDVFAFIARQPRPFRMVADPEGRIYEALGVESSRWGKAKAMMTRMASLRRGMLEVGMSGMLRHAKGAMGLGGGTGTNNLMPADFLIDELGNIAETYYGTDAGDHIPIAHIERFLAR